ncbi:toll-like receptor 4 [Mytilus californianus]|uniref:toll-like receptor 4 n=1 Tax=Mytilus californianus TaxID=6549 RepID=UPI002247D4D9|nr:toll-like receptor 4 [Mytilus californianus]
MKRIVASILILTITLAKDLCKKHTDGENVYCFCRYRNLSTVPDDCAENTTVLDMRGNHMRTLYNRFFTGLPYLRKLILSHSYVERIEVLAFYNLFQLDSLDLRHNFIGSDALPNGVFQSLMQLKRLDLSYNTFSEYPDKQLSDLVGLGILSINGINGKKFGKGFSKLTNLEQFRLQPCKYEILHNDTFKYLRDLPITYFPLECKIRKVETGAFFPLQHLTSISIYRNRVIQISNLLPSFIAFRGHNMSSILLDNNNFYFGKRFDTLSKNDGAILGDICARTISLASNSLIEIRLGFFHAMKYRNCIETLILRGNSLNRHQEYIFELNLLINLKYVDLSKQNPYFLIGEKTLRNNYIGTPSGFTIKLPSTLKFINYSNIITKNTKLAPKVKVVDGYNVEVLDFANAQYISCNTTIWGFANLKNFNFSGSSCSLLSPTFFRYLKRLDHLTFRNAQLSRPLGSYGFEKLLHGLVHLRYIDFSQNNLKMFVSNLFVHQKHSLKKLILDANDFTDIPITVSDFRKMLHLDLRNNKIEYIHKHVMADIDKAMSDGCNLTIFLSGNPLKCNCDTIDFIEWLFRTNVILDAEKNYSCSDTDGTIRTTTWAYSNLRETRLNCISTTYLTISIILTSSVIIFVIMMSWVCKYKIALKYWYYNIRWKYRLFKDINTRTNFKYDVFVGYHHTDHKFVSDKMVAFLEYEKGLKLCLHQRDFLAGLYIADNIINAIKDSRKVLFVISTNYLKSKWGRFEFDMARMQMFQENLEPLIIMLLENISPSEMPSDLIDIWERITCIEADEVVRESTQAFSGHQFWEKLYIAVKP